MNTSMNVTSLPSSLPITQHNNITCNCDPICDCPLPAFDRGTHLPMLRDQFSAVASDLSLLEAAEAVRKLSRGEERMRATMLSILSRNAKLIVHYAAQTN